MKKTNIYKLGAFIDINPKLSLSKGKEYSFVEMKDLDATYKYVSPSTKKEYTSGSKFQNKDTLFARITPCLENGKICQVKNLENNIGFGSTEFLVFRGKNEISDSDFVYYLSRSEFVRNNAIQMMTGSSGRQRVEKSALEELEIEVPDIAVQKQIAQILTSLDDKIESLQKMNETLSSITQTIFKEWFFNFNFPGFDGDLIDGLPKGWKKGSNGEVISFKNGKSSPERDDSFSFPVYGSNGIIGYSKYFNAEENVTIIGRVGSFCGSTYLSMKKCWVTDNAIIAQSRQNYSIFTYLTLLNQNLNNFRAGSGQPLLNQSILSGIPLNIPDKLIIEEFEKQAMPYFMKIEMNLDNIKIIENIRNTLLNRMISGKIEIKN